MPKLSEVLFGKKGKFTQTPIFTPEQESFLNQLMGGSREGISSGMDYLTSLLSGDEGAFQAFEAPYKRIFEEETIPSIAERFANLDAQSSGAFKQSLSQAGAGLSENLAALREGLKSQALSQLTQLGGIGLQPRYNTMYEPGTSGAMGNLMGGLFGGLGQIASGGLTDWFSSFGNANKAASATRSLPAGSKNPFLNQYKIGIGGF